MAIEGLSAVIVVSWGLHWVFGSSGFCCRRLEYWWGCRGDLWSPVLYKR
ncbi:MAG: hypothetical protein R3Y53_01185 [Bacillota bacterium]